MKVLDFALQMEELGKNYYERLAAETSLNGIRAVFSMLAEEQQELYDTFQAMKRGASAHCNADSLALDRAWRNFGKIFAAGSGTIDLLKNDLDAYRHAIQVEADIVRFFEELASSENNAEARALINEIAAMERKAYRRVENIHDFVAAPKWQLSWGEFSNLNEF
ncbi:ferritin [Geotalea uraniireducens]|uniref:Ferritin n=1 Tax=Geotalea uraniireducens TaxID=351604 RepID=A0ABM8EPH5_9BACT|nr:ferritin family protein [Geotalea uraniireducens]BDV44370.1 ferritin [Geotalea uraniireducens]